MKDTIHCTIQGKGRPLLFIHGWAMHSRVWDKTARILARDFQVITVDLRGHGRSRDHDGPFTYDVFARDLAGLIYGLELRDLTLVGWSLGASVVFKMLKHTFIKPRSLVLISANPSLVKRADYPHGIAEVMVKRLYQNTGRDLAKGLESFYRLLFSDTELTALAQDDVYKTITDPDLSPAKPAALQTLKCLQNEDLRTVLPDIRVPTLLIHGTEDRISLPGAAAFMNRQIKGSRLLLLGNTGHVPFVTREKEVLEQLCPFLKNS